MWGFDVGVGLGGVCVLLVNILVRLLYREEGAGACV